MVIRDPVHGDIEIDEQLIKDLIDTASFQRLRRIKQLAGSELAFPGATHTRFTHSLGVYHLIQLVLKQTAFRNFAYQEKLMITVAGLLHDIGHGPFSHTFEMLQTINPIMQSHEMYAVQLINDQQSDIHLVLQKYFSASEMQIICDVILGQAHHKFLLADLVSSQLDMDRIDYLLRDDCFAGTGYGYIDTQWIIRNMLIDKQCSRIVFKAKCLYAIENYLVGRYHMYCQVYNHHISRGFNLLFGMIFKRIYDLWKQRFSFAYIDKTFCHNLLTQPALTTKQYYELDDYWMWCFLARAKQEDDLVLKTLVHNFQRRSFFRPDHDATFLQKYQSAVEAKYEKENLRYFLIHKQITPPSFYNPHQYGIYIQKENQKPINIYDCSPLIQAYQPKQEDGAITFVINPLF